MLNGILTHEFKTFGGLIGAVRQSSVALRSCLSGHNLPDEFDAQLRRIERDLEVLLREVLQRAGEFEVGSRPIDLEFANANYMRGIHEWRNNLTQLLEIVDDSLKNAHVPEAEEMRETLAPLRTLQQLQVKTLKERVDRYRLGEQR